MPNQAAMRIGFTKMSGAGNDFVLIDNLSGELSVDWKDIAQPVCRRRLGIGADGLLVLERGSAEPFIMRYYNADGSSGGMCGNGGRCAARYYMDLTGSNDVSFEAVGRRYSARRAGSLVTLMMGNPGDLRANLRIDQGSGVVRAHFIDTGAPHAVIFQDEQTPPLSLGNIPADEFRQFGRSIRSHPAFQPGGANVDIVQLNPDGSLSMRTYERGVEEETLACGTGAVACALAASVLRGVDSPVTILTRSNERLTVRFTRNRQSFDAVELEGSARITYTGFFDYPFL